MSNTTRFNEEQACENPIEDQRAAALKHYEEVSSQACHWSGFVEAAIKAYNPSPTPGQVKTGREATPMETMLEFMNGLLKIEDNLILQYSKQEHCVKDVKENWQQLNMIKEMVITLLAKEKKQTKEAQDEALFYLSELVRTVSRLVNNWPHALTDEDLDRLTQSKDVLARNASKDKSQHLTQSSPTPIVEGVSKEGIINKYNPDGFTKKPQLPLYNHNKVVLMMEQYASQFTTPTKEAGTDAVAFSLVEAKEILDKMGDDCIHSFSDSKFCHENNKCKMCLK